MKHILFQNLKESCSKCSRNNMHLFQIHFVFLTERQPDMKVHKSGILNFYLNCMPNNYGSQNINMTI